MEAKSSKLKKKTTSEHEETPRGKRRRYGCAGAQNFPTAPQSAQAAMFRTSSSSAARTFTTSAASKSFIGRTPVRLVPEVTCTTEQIPQEFCKTFTKGKHTISLNRQIVVKGPKGTLKMQVPSFVKVHTSDENAVHVSVRNPQNKIQRSMWGTLRALVQNHVIGTTEGHLAIVKFVGTGYRVAIEDNGACVALKIGYPFTPKLKVPAGLSVSSPNPARLLIEGMDKQQVKLFAARIREFRKPEPYKGKGIFVDDETIKLKQKKIK